MSIAGHFFEKLTDGTDFFLWSIVLPSKISILTEDSPHSLAGYPGSFGKRIAIYPAWTIPLRPNLEHFDSLSSKFGADIPLRTDVRWRPTAVQECIQCGVNVLRVEFQWRHGATFSQSRREQAVNADHSKIEAALSKTSTDKIFIYIPLIFRFLGAMKSSIASSTIPTIESKFYADSLIAPEQQEIEICCAALSTGSVGFSPV